MVLKDYGVCFREGLKNIPNFFFGGKRQLLRILWALYTIFIAVGEAGDGKAWTRICIEYICARDLATRTGCAHGYNHAQKDFPRSCLTQNENILGLKVVTTPTQPQHNLN